MREKLQELRNDILKAEENFKKYAVECLEPIKIKFDGIQPEDLKPYKKSHQFKIYKNSLTDKEFETLSIIYWDEHLNAKEIIEAVGLPSISTLTLMMPKQDVSPCIYCGGDIVYMRTSKTCVKPEVCKTCEDERTLKAQERYELKKAEDFERRIQESIRQQDLNFMSYKEYLQTDEWKNIRTQSFRRANFKCELCGKGGKLNTHHRNYTERGQERPSDLIVLCESCHKKHHDVI